MDVKTPECDKLTAAAPVSQKIGEFLEWLRETKDVSLAQWGSDNQLHPLYLDTNKLLAEFFGVDLNVVEKERRSLLDQLRNSP